MGRYIGKTISLYYFTLIRAFRFSYCVEQEYKEASSLVLKSARRKKSELRQKKVNSVISELGMYEGINGPEMMNRFARRAMRSKKAFNQMLDKVTRHAFNQLDPGL